jgi:hypothetical protein
MAPLAGLGGSTVVEPQTWTVLSGSRHVVLLAIGSALRTLVSLPRFSGRLATARRSSVATAGGLILMHSTAPPSRCSICSVLSSIGPAKASPWPGASAQLLRRGHPCFSEPLTHVSIYDRSHQTTVPVRPRMSIRTTPLHPRYRSRTRVQRDCRPAASLLLGHAKRPRRLAPGWRPTAYHPVPVGSV